jgi:hypothetical protein
MPRFVIKRTLGDISDEELQGAAVHSKEVREDQFPELTWDHSHVVKADGGLVSYCVYDGPSADVARAHARAAGLPADEVFEVHTDIDPAEL